MNDIEFMLQEDNREKKQTANGARHKTGKRGMIGHVRLPSAFLSGKEKRDYTAPGEVVSYNMYERMFTDMLKRISAGELPVRSEIEALPFEQAQDVIVAIRERYSNKQLMEAWHMPAVALQRYLNERYKTMKTGGRHIRVSKVVDVPESPPVVEAPPMLQGTQICIVGEFAGKELYERCLKLAQFVENNECDFKVTISIQEVVK